ncbi:hypothetical protein SAMN04488057_101256 [Cyclobacterium lianum]|uniref:Magnesium citrate secondary transporter n=1 Tax=Cyclobacterium lianum TaxID=388280 RepID=A0A1M7I9Z4_9BACT|nr:magnesium citrate secondary transporter [Cyclobacterium lianum]SHM37564.1 hypothetical protein SAMN04488057_101256 [Cyclobacterium lianum]
MSVLKNPCFFIPVLLFWTNQYLEKVKQVFIPFLFSYLDDLLAMPVVLGITLQVYRWIHPRRENFLFTSIQVGVGLVYFGILFEGLLPIWSATYTRDLWDLLCYLLGAIWFYYFINTPKR